MVSDLLICGKTIDGILPSYDDNLDHREGNLIKAFIKLSMNWKQSTKEYTNSVSNVENNPIQFDIWKRRNGTQRKQCEAEQRA